MSRLSTVERLNLTDNDIRRAWDDFGAVKTVAAEWGCSAQTARKLLKSVGVDLKPSPTSPDRERKGEFAQWLQDNPDTPLPRNCVEIAEISGIPYGNVKSYYYRTASDRYEQWEKALPGWLETAFPVVTDAGITIPRSRLKACSFSIDRFRFNCKVKLITTSGTHYVTLDDDIRLPYLKENHVLEEVT